ncbi:MAG: hypothetical protein ACYC26_04625 [Phycisphaerales bacterium]
MPNLRQRHPGKVSSVMISSKPSDGPELIGESNLGDCLLAVSLPGGIISFNRAATTRMINKAVTKSSFALAG